jgi:SAM-dependent methyltransferase
MQYQTYEEDSIPLDASSPYFWDHVSRYWWSTQYVGGKSVLDCACGRGYGSYILSSAAKNVVGVDLNAPSLFEAAKQFKKNNLSFKEWDVFKLPELGKFDVITAFEVIEHLPPSQTESFLKSLRGSLNPGGILLLSTPNHDVVKKSGAFIPEFHINNFRAADLKRILLKHFGDVQMIGQFKKRKGINALVFDFDFFNLRHLLKSFVKTHANSNSNPSDRSIQKYLESRPEQVDEYKFSPNHWRQSGLSLAICRS